MAKLKLISALIEDGGNPATALYHPFMGSDQFNKDIDDRHSSNKRTFRGRGLYAYVDQDKSDHELDNVNRIAPNTPQEAGQMYHHTLSRIQDKINNPYFPKIFGYERKPAGESSTTEYKMERLHSLTSPAIMAHPSQIQTLLVQMFGRRAEIAEDDPALESANSRAKLLSEWIKAALLHEVEARDPQLREALEIIRSIARRGDYTIDLHPGNMMWRITGNRPQLVITDPLQ